MTTTYKKINPKVKKLPKCDKCLIILSNNKIYNTRSKFDLDLCNQCYQNYTGMSGCCDALIINGRCSDCKEGV